MSASYTLNATSASYANNATSASYATTASYWSGSITNSLSASYALTASYSANVPVTSSYANNAASASYSLTASYAANVPQTSSYAISASNALTASYLSGYVSPFPFTGSAIISGSLTVTGSVAVSNLSGSGVRYLVADESGSITAQSASAALKSTQAFTSTAGQTTFAVTNGYSTGYVDVFINGSKLATAEFTDTSGTNIVLATGSFSGDTVEVVKYTPAAGVTNNVLRQLTTLTGSAGQTVFSASYTPGLIDIFYNGSKLSPSDFTANNGTFFTLATGSAANDILDVLVYSYQVGAFSGIGGVGTAAQVAYFDTTNSITGSPNFTISGSTMTVTGSLIVSGSGTFTNIGPAVFSGSLTSTAGFTGSFSGTATSASFAATASSADNFLTRGTLTAQTLVVQTITSSVDFVTGSTRFGSISANTHVFTGSMAVSGSATFSGSINIGTAGSEKLNIFGTGSQYINVKNTTTNADMFVGISSPLAAGFIGTGGNDPLVLTTAGVVRLTLNGTTGAATFTNTETTLNFNPQTNLLASYYYLNFGGGSIMYRNASDIYIGSNSKYGSAGTTVANYTSANGMGMLTMDGGNLNYQSNATSVTAGTAYSMPIRFSITGAGNVGIGTTSPSKTLDMVGDAYAGIGINDGTNTAVMQWHASDGFRIVTATAKPILFFANNTERVRITSDGCLLINNTLTDIATLIINGFNTLNGTVILRNPSKGANDSHIHYSTYGDWYIRPSNNSGSVYVKNYVAESDARLKDNIENISYGLDEILSLTPRKFNWKEGNNKEVNGFIAQEVEKIIPNLVSEGQWKSVDYQGITAILVKALQEANAKITALQEKLERNNIN
jgi:hypothetical protein